MENERSSMQDAPISNLDMKKSVKESDPGSFIDKKQMRSILKNSYARLISTSKSLISKPNAKEHEEIMRSLSALSLRCKLQFPLSEFQQLIASMKSAQIEKEADEKKIVLLNNEIRSIKSKIEKARKEADTNLSRLVSMHDGLKELPTLNRRIEELQISETQLKQKLGKRELELEATKEEVAQDLKKINHDFEQEHKENLNVQASRSLEVDRCVSEYSSRFTNWLDSKLDEEKWFYEKKIENLEYEICKVQEERVKQAEHLKKMIERKRRVAKIRMERECEDKGLFNHPSTSADSPSRRLTSFSSPTFSEQPLNKKRRFSFTIPEGFRTDVAESPAMQNWKSVQNDSQNNEKRIVSENKEFDKQGIFGAASKLFCESPAKNSPIDDENCFKKPEPPRKLSRTVIQNAFTPSFASLAGDSSVKGNSKSGVHSHINKSGKKAKNRSRTERIGSAKPKINFVPPLPRLTNSNSSPSFSTTDFNRPTANTLNSIKGVPNKDDKQGLKNRKKLFTEPLGHQKF